MSNAELRSKRNKIEQSPLSALTKRSFVTFKRAVSVLCIALKPDWNFSKMVLKFIKVISWFETIFSKTFDKNGSLEIGLKLFKTSGSSDTFFKRGWTTAFLKLEGTMPEDSERFMMERIVGATVIMFSLRKAVGIMSSEHDVVFICVTISRSAGSVMGVSEVSWEGGEGHSIGTDGSGDSCSLIPSILLRKCFRNSSHFSGEASMGWLGGGFMTD